MDDMVNFVRLERKYFSEATSAVYQLFDQGHTILVLELYELVSAYTYKAHLISSERSMARAVVAPSNPWKKLKLEKLCRESLVHLGHSANSGNLITLLTLQT